MINVVQYPSLNEASPKLAPEGNLSRSNWESIWWTGRSFVLLPFRNSVSLSIYLCSLTTIRQSLNCMCSCLLSLWIKNHIRINQYLDAWSFNNNLSLIKKNLCQPTIDLICLVWDLCLHWWETSLISRSSERRWAKEKWDDDLKLEQERSI